MSETDYEDAHRDRWARAREAARKQTPRALRFLRSLLGDRTPDPDHDPEGWGGIPWGGPSPVGDAGTLGDYARRALEGSARALPALVELLPEDPAFWTPRLRHALTHDVDQAQPDALRAAAELIDDAELAAHWRSMARLIETAPTAGGQAPGPERVQAALEALNAHGHGVFYLYRQADAPELVLALLLHPESTRRQRSFLFSALCRDRRSSARPALTPAQVEAVHAYWEEVAPHSSTHEAKAAAELFRRLGAAGD